MTKAIAERVFGWKAVHKDQGKLVGKKRDKGGRWRKAGVPEYAGDQRLAYKIDERMKELGRWDQYAKQLSKITKAENLPADWGTPAQRCKAALTVISAHLRLVRARKGGS